MKKASAINSKNVEVFKIGSHKDESVKYVLQTNPSYIRFLKDKGWSFSEFIENLKLALFGHYITIIHNLENS